MWSPAIDRQANQEAEDFFGSFGEAPPPPMPRSPQQTQPQFDDVPLSSAPEEEHRPSNAVSAAALGEASPEQTVQGAPEASTTASDNPEATAPRHGSILGRLWGPPSGSTDPEINAPPAEEPFAAPAEEQPAAAAFGAPPDASAAFAAPPQESGEDLGWGVEDIGDDDDEGVWNDEPDTPSPHLETLTNYLQRHNPAKAGNAPRLLKEYRGREQELFANIERKYGEPVVSTPSMPPRVMSATMSNMENAATQPRVPETPQQPTEMRRALSTMENAGMSPSQSWTPAPVSNAEAEAESAEKLFGAQPEEKAVAEMFDAIVEEEAFSGQPPGRVATGELFGGEVSSLAAADAFTAARDAEAHRAASMAGIQPPTDAAAAFGAPPTDAAGAFGAPPPEAAAAFAPAPEDQPVELQTEFTFAPAAEQPGDASAAFGAPPPDAAAAFAPAPEEQSAAAAFDAPPDAAAAAFGAPPPDAAAAFGAPPEAAGAFDAPPADAAFPPAPEEPAAAAFGPPPTDAAAAAFGAPPEEQAFGAPPTDAAAAFDAPPTAAAEAFGAPEELPAELQTEFTFAPAEEQPAAAAFGAPPDASAAFAPAPEEPAAASMFGAPPPGDAAAAFAPAPEEPAGPVSGFAAAASPAFGAPPEQQPAFGASPPDAAAAFGAAPEEQPAAAAFGAPPADAAAQFGAPPPDAAAAFGAPPTDASAAFDAPQDAAAMFGAPPEQQASYDGPGVNGHVPPPEDFPPAAAAMFGGVPSSFYESPPAAPVFGSPASFGAEASPAAAEAFEPPPPPAPPMPAPPSPSTPPASTALEVTVDGTTATARCGAVACTCVVQALSSTATGLPLLDALVAVLANAADATLALETTIGGQRQQFNVDYATAPRPHDSALFSCAGAAVGAACREAFRELGQAKVTVVRGGAVVAATLEAGAGAVVCDAAPYGRAPRGGRLRVGTYRTCLTPLFFEALGLHLGRGLRLASQRTGDARDCLEAAFAACGRLLRVARPGESMSCGPRTGSAASCSVDLDRADETSDVATGVAAVDALLKALADVAGWRLQVRAADGDGDGRALSRDVGAAVGSAVEAAMGTVAGDGAGASGAVTACVATSSEGSLTWDVRVADEYVDESFAAEHVERLFSNLARAAGLRLHVAAPGVLPAADMMEDAARAVGSALREALQPVSI